MNTALISYDYASEFINLSDADKAITNLALQSGTQYIRQYIHKKLFLNYYHEKFNYQSVLILKNHHVNKVNMVAYVPYPHDDTYHTDDYISEIEDYIWDYPEREIDLKYTMLYNYPIYKHKTIWVNYTAGYHCLNWYGEEPSSPSLGDVWQNYSNEYYRRIIKSDDSYPLWDSDTLYLEGDVVEHDGVDYLSLATHGKHLYDDTAWEPGVGDDWEDMWEVYTGSDSWASVDEEDVIGSHIIHALLEILMYNKQRIVSKTVGVRSRSGGQAHTIANQGLEVSIPENARELLAGEIYHV
jgi:hypothetical protein